LMEPMRIVDPQKVQADLREVGSRFLSYRAAIGDLPKSKRRIALIAYVLQGGGQDQRRRAIEGLRGTHAEVVDLGLDGASEAFTGRVRDVGSSGGASAQLAY